MLPIPRFYKSSASLVCDNTATYPAGVSTPSLWYRGDAATASTDTAGKNTVDASSFYTRINDFGSYGIPLVPFTPVWTKFRYNTSQRKNGLDVIYAANDNTSYAMTDSNELVTIGQAGKGTIIAAYKNGNNAGNVVGWRFQGRNQNTQAYGFYFRWDKSTIFGDSQSYTYASSPSTNYITVISVSASGVPIYTYQNGIQAATASYDTMSNQGSTLNVTLSNESGSIEDGSSMYEAMYFETPLSAADCAKVETYLKQKWCISY